MPILAEDTKPEAGKQVALSFDYKNSEGRESKIHYWLYLPPRATTTESPLPLLLFLHGAGERGDNLDLVRKHGPPSLVGSRKELDNFIVVSPQCPEKVWWDTAGLKALCDHVVSSQKADANRIYLTGLSMGGFATWALLAEHPTYWAAAVPICGGGKPETAAKFKDVPIWVFHGAKDDRVSVALSDAMVAALKKEGGQPKYTIYPEAGHNSWTETYANADLYQWLLEQKRAPAKEK